MKRKGNYSLIDDDISGQLAFTGLENSVRVAPVKTIELKKLIKKPNLKLSWRELDKLKKQYNLEMFLFSQDNVSYTPSLVQFNFLIKQDDEYFKKKLSSLLKDIKL